MDSNPNYINPKDFDVILDTIPLLNIRKWDNEDIQYLFKILYHMALRPSEGIKLKSADFDLKNRICYLGKTKTSTSDRAIIPKVFVDDLEGYLLDKPDGRLFPGLTYRTLWVWLKRLGKMLDIDAWKHGNRTRMRENTVGHIFRKSWGKDMVEKYGYEKIDVISTHMRHKDIAITMNSYLKANIEKVKETI